MKDTTRLERLMDGEDPKTVLEAEWDADDHMAASGMLRMAFDKMAGLIDMFSLNDAIKDKVKKLKKEFKKFRSKFRPILHGEEVVDSLEVEGKKRFNVKYNVGKAKYLLSYHDGKQKHKDGSDFFDVMIYQNKKEFEKAQQELLRKGYIAEATTGDISYSRWIEELVDEAKIGEGALYVLNVEYQANGTYDVTYLIGDEQDNATTMKGLNRGKMEKLVADIMKNVI